MTTEIKKQLKHAKNEKYYKKGTVINAKNKMDRNYTYILEKNYGDMSDYPDFTPHLTPKEMLILGIFEGKYLNDCISEFPKEWYQEALKANTLSPEKPNIYCNYFKIKSRMSLQEWINRGWIFQTNNDPDNRGWFQWYCRFYIGRRIPELDQLQINRWKKYARHYAQVKKNCSDITCRPKQRQSLLQWAYNPFVVS